MCDLLVSQAQSIRNSFFPTKGLHYRQKYSSVGGPDVEVLGWRGYMGSAVVRPVRRIAKFSKMIFEAVYGREMNN